MIALSRGESEFYALVKAFAVCIRTLFKHYSAIEIGNGCCMWFCCGKLQETCQNVQTRYLWIQDRVAKNKLKIVAVGTKLSDLCTEPANKGTCEKHMESLNQILYQIFAKGKASGAKSLTPWQVQKQWTMHQGGVFIILTFHSFISFRCILAQRKSVCALTEFEWHKLCLVWDHHIPPHCLICQNVCWICVSCCHESLSFLLTLTLKKRTPKGNTLQKRTLPRPSPTPPAIPRTAYKQAVEVLFRQGFGIFWAPVGLGVWVPLPWY